MPQWARMCCVDGVYPSFLLAGCVAPAANAGRRWKIRLEDDGPVLVAISHTESSPRRMWVVIGWLDESLY